MAKGAIVGKTKRIRWVKEGLFKKRKEEIEAYTYREIWPEATLAQAYEEIHHRIKKFRENADFGMTMYGMDHTHTPDFESEWRKDGNRTVEIPRIAKTPKDALLYHLLFQLAVTHLLHRGMPGGSIERDALGEMSGKMLDKFAVEREAHVIEDEYANDETEMPNRGRILKDFDAFAKDENLEKMAEELYPELLATTRIRGITEEDVEYALKKARDFAKKIVTEELEGKVKTHHLDSNPMLVSAVHNEDLIKFLAGLREGERKEKPELHKGKKPVSENITLETHKLLGILSGLKFAGYSHKAVERAVEELDARVDELMKEKNLELLGLYLGFQRLLEKRDFEGAEEFLRGLS